MCGAGAAGEQGCSAHVCCAGTCAHRGRTPRSRGGRRPRSPRRAGREATGAGGTCATVRGRCAREGCGWEPLTDASPLSSRRGGGAAAPTPVERGGVAKKPRRRRQSGACRRPLRWQPRRKPPDRLRRLPKDLAAWRRHPRRLAQTCAWTQASCLRGLRLPVAEGSCMYSCGKGPRAMWQWHGVSVAFHVSVSHDLLQKLRPLIMHRLLYTPV